MVVWYDMVIVFGSAWCEVQGLCGVVWYGVVWCGVSCGAVAVNGRWEVGGEGLVQA